MSTLKVDSLVEKTSGNGVHIAGHVIQVTYSVSTGQSTSVATTSNNNADTATGFFANITPTSADSKILVMLTSNIQHTGAAGQAVIWGMRRGTTPIARSGSGGAFDYIEYSNVDNNFHTTVNLKYVDSPASTSLLRYELYLSNYGGGSSTVRDWGTTNITLMEIAQ
jgi:hypothetical protein